jgi:hypothetical protein
MCKSEIALLREQIELELQAMRRGIGGFALGTARHAFIQARMEQVGSYQDSLASYIGTDAATHVVCKLYMQAMECDSSEVRS